MKGLNFLNSKWCKRASSPENQKEIIDKFLLWSKKVKNTEILKKAGLLYDFFKSPVISAADKALVAGAILYIITPIDLIPDFAPFAGFLDDLGVAAYALAYINSRLNEIDTSKLIESEISETDKDNMQNT